MPASLPFAVSCRGGLNKNLSQFEMLANPGLASELTNFEVDNDGGYRRINGFTAFGGTDATRPNSSNAILGLFVYADGLIVTSGTNIYFTLDGITYLQINRASVSGSGDNYSTFTGRSVAARTSQTQCNFTFYEGDSQYGEVVITDESSASKPFLFKIVHSSANLCISPITKLLYVFSSSFILANSFTGSNPTMGFCNSNSSIANFQELRLISSSKCFSKATIKYT